MNKIKVCGLFQENDIEYVNIAKPDYVGFIVNFKKSHRSIDYDKAKTLIKKLDKNIKSVCVFVNADVDTVLKFAEFADVVQLHGDEDNDYIKNLRLKNVDLEIWKAFKVKTKKDLDLAKQCTADKILLDNGYGTGQKFDWSLVEEFNREFILAGGINSDNILSAVNLFNPYCVDVSSGVEENKVKSYNKICEIVKTIRQENKLENKDGQGGNNEER